MSDFHATHKMKRIIQIAGIGAIIFGGYALYAIFLSIRKMYGTEEFWLSVIGFAILAGFALIPCYVGVSILHKMSQQSLQLLCALYVAAASYTGAVWSLPLKMYFPSMQDSIWQNIVLLTYVVFGILIWRALNQNRPYVHLAECVDILHDSCQFSLLVRRIL